MAYYLKNDPPGVDDLIVHEYFALVNGAYSPNDDGDIVYEFDKDLADTWKRIATEFNELMELKSSKSQKRVSETNKTASIIEKRVIT